MATPDLIRPIPSHRWEVFCTVVDNYGDIGVCWRLARQLVQDYGQQVRLWVDDLAAFARLEPTLDPSLPEQSLAGVRICHWPRGDAPFPLPAELGDIVIEAFACPLPEAVEGAMARQSPPPVWLNLEYLSAEAWVEDCHLMVSRHPRWNLDKHFFFPGFTLRTGGLLREQGLLTARKRFQAPQAGERDAFLADLGITLAPGERLVSLFAYATPVLGELFQVLAVDSAQPTRLLLLDRPAQETARAWSGQPLPLGVPYRQGALTVQPLPFLRQADFDRLLWSCDLNLVRGEDSFVRAQWAGRPFVWLIYPQDEQAHLTKLKAFLQRYSEGLPADAAVALNDFWLHWNGALGQGADLARDWAALQAQLPTLRHHAEAWCATLAEQENLAGALVRFCANRLK
ncbi:hypothetical protein OTERR_17510 [Oryzomicrobium terrae]|uniref:Protein-arginine rhamnosyltransferase n=1 Tax=Oryzomicrobium terrae TaxID=1735038 RepID=A0A5C1EAN5_9RHOO|nr:elongation factor P maturation arginine rhamnosyltransferase EarP [Oryzomicrobium terrae]QEL65227.1 hypothetical protein OTERR_17510 [Oryzomicrobium terrae]